MTQKVDVGTQLKAWRERRRLTQLGLSSAAGVSTRHLSFIETGRSKPSKDMIIHLSECLDVPLRQRNSLLLAGGHAPAYSQSALAEAPMAAVSDAINRIIDAHDPFPAVVVDHHWDLIAGNRAVGILTEGSAPFLLEPPVNVLRLSLHPEGMAPRIVNLAQWRTHVIARLRREVEVTADAQLGGLLEELRTYPSGGEWHEDEMSSLLVPLRIRAGDTELAMFSTTTVFGTPRDVTLAEIAIESFYPSDPATAEFFRSVG
ncbi:helix-turn-helix domain-containing protein [Rhodococcus sp. ARC_M6]|uniref:helix-turn-helix domain-containing protein n=1 Tax=Rhodococcus sp. ARC_M6 TaxID=2928852 RepID=UPI001FB4557E|nr:helix-turn-helix transcriptional regulator [Rhodococcus sp. ARC_M6]MCJ0903359.1 helix-turn-helix transcriptional regulator [Rhodococcus sp. ARC_M6]